MGLTIRKGFTLIELVLASLMFGFIMMSLASIYSTANKHMFQSYRQNTVKSTVSTAMKSITNSLAEANRIDLPAIGGDGDSLRFAVNVDQNGCYPINPALPVSWHEFCYAPGKTAQCPSGNCLYHHTGAVAVPGGNTGCPDGTAWPAVYPVFSGLCGNAVGTVTQLAAFVEPPAGTPIFSRSGALGATVVNIRLRVLWDPAATAVAGRDFRTTATPIDTTLTTSVRVTRTGQ